MYIFATVQLDSFRIYSSASGFVMPLLQCIWIPIVLLRCIWIPIVLLLCTDSCGIWIWYSAPGFVRNIECIPTSIEYLPFPAIYFNKYPIYIGTLFYFSVQKVYFLFSSWPINHLFCFALLYECKKEQC